MFVYDESLRLTSIEADSHRQLIDFWLHFLWGIFESLSCTLTFQIRPLFPSSTLWRPTGQACFHFHILQQFSPNHFFPFFFFPFSLRCCMQKTLNTSPPLSHITRHHHRSSLCLLFTVDWLNYDAKRRKN